MIDREKIKLFLLNKDIAKGVAIGASISNLCWFAAAKIWGIE
jgi:hypothetical protein